MYHTGIGLYRIALRVASLFHPKARLFVRGRRGQFARIREQIEADTRPRIWMHCASLGEFEQGRPLLEAIRERFPHYSLVLTFFSPSGYEVRKNYEGADHIFYLPLDSKRNAARFIGLVQPRCALFVKYEFWYHYLAALHRGRVPTVLFSALFQPRHPFFKWYGGLYRRMLGYYDHIFVQDQASCRLLEQLGVRHVSVTGDTRFDRAAKVLEQQRAFPQLDIFKDGYELLIAGSTWHDDEDLLEKVFRQLPGTYKLLIAPHETDDAHITRLQGLFPGSCLWNAAEPALRKSRVAIVHTVGQLAYLYRYADVVWVGGGFTRSGIHNVIEPAVFGKPVFFGPVYGRYQEAVAMVSLQAAESIPDAGILRERLADKKALQHMGCSAREYVQSRLGATQAILLYLSEKCLSSMA